MLTPEISSPLDLAWRIYRAFTPKWSKYIKGTPHPKQHLFLCLDDVEELFFGGAAGPGKSWALLAASLQYADQPDYNGLLVRRNYPDLAQPGGLLSLSHEWLDGSDAHWDGTNKRWDFPVGGSLSFGHMDNPADLKRYKGGEYQFIGIDELTDFQEREAMFFHSRLRRRVGSKIPLRWRGGSNPGGPGHEWVKVRYVDAEPSADRAFIPATIYDNPYVDIQAYLKGLAKLDPVTRARLIKGDWDVRDRGGIFDRSWFTKFLDFPPVEVIARYRAWDLAATDTPTSKETAGILMSRTLTGQFVVEHAIHGKWTPGPRDGVILQAAMLDGESTRVLIEEEPGSGGITQNSALIRMLAGYRAESVKVTGDKFVRAGALASQAEAGNVTLVRGRWNHDFLEQLHVASPEGDMLIDMMDAASLAFNRLLLTPLSSSAIETPDPKKSEGEDRGDDEDLDERGEQGKRKFDFTDSRGWEGAGEW